MWKFVKLTRKWSFQVLLIQVQQHPEKINITWMQALYHDDVEDVVILYKIWSTTAFFMTMIQNALFIDL